MRSGTCPPFCGASYVAPLPRCVCVCRSELMASSSSPLLCRAAWRSRRHSSKWCASTRLRARTHAQPRTHPHSLHTGAAVAPRQSAILRTQRPYTLAPNVHALTASSPCAHCILASSAAHSLSAASLLRKINKGLGGMAPKLWANLNELGQQIRGSPLKMMVRAEIGACVAARMRSSTHAYSSTHA